MRLLSASKRLLQVEFWLKGLHQNTSTPSGDVHMIKKLGITLLFLALGSVSALAADFNGKWTGDVQGRNGNTQTLTFDFHVDGTTLTGKITTPRGDVDLSNGKVDGDNISFDQVLNFNGNSITISYKGTADGADSIKFTRTFGSNGDRPPQDFVAKRGSADAAPAAPAAPAQPAPPATPPPPPTGTTATPQ
jgi:hypothetical protein